MIGTGLLNEEFSSCRACPDTHRPAPIAEDPVEAFAWFSAAADQGVPGAEEEKEFVAGRMDRDQALRAGKLSRSYWARYVAAIMR